MNNRVARTFLLLLPLLLTLAVAGANQPPPMSHAELGDAVQAIVELRADRGLLLIGELHGSWEAPRIATGVVEHLSGGGPVRLALEIPVQEQARVDAFLVSDGTVAAVAELLAGTFWQMPIERSDGRRSVAMVELLQRVRALRATGADVEIGLIDDAEFKQRGVDRHDGMAAALAGMAAQDPARPVVALIGNYHARRAPVTSRLLFDGEPLDAPPMPTAMRISGVEFASVDIRTCSGAHWACSGGACGERSLGDRCAGGDPVRLQPLEAESDGYDLRVSLQRLTVAVPARPGAPAADKRAP